MAITITHARTPPGTPQYKGVAERALDLRKENAIARLDDLTKQHSEKLWAEVMSMATDMSNVCITTDSTSPYEKWHGEVLNTKNIQPFGTVG